MTTALHICLSSLGGNALGKRDPLQCRTGCTCHWTEMWTTVTRSLEDRLCAAVCPILALSLGKSAP